MFSLVGSALGVYQPIYDAVNRLTARVVEFEAQILVKVVETVDLKFKELTTALDYKLQDRVDQLEFSITESQLSLCDRIANKFDSMYKGLELTTEKLELDVSKLMNELVSLRGLLLNVKKLENLQNEKKINTELTEIKKQIKYYEQLVGVPVVRMYIGNLHHTLTSDELYFLIRRNKIPVRYIEKINSRSEAFSSFIVCIAKSDIDKFSTLNRFYKGARIGPFIYKREKKVVAITDNVISDIEDFRTNHIVPELSQLRLKNSAQEKLEAEEKLRLLKERAYYFDVDKLVRFVRGSRNKKI